MYCSCIVLNVDLFQRRCISFQKFQGKIVFVSILIKVYNLLDNEANSSIFLLNPFALACSPPGHSSESPHRTSNIFLIVVRNLPKADRLVAKMHRKSERAPSAAEQSHDQFNRCKKLHMPRCALRRRCVERCIVTAGSARLPRKTRDDL